MSAPPRILAIAGSDSSGGAGIQADIKTITMLGGYAMTAITCVTAQNTLGVSAVEALSPEMVGAQIDACLSDIGADAIKIGMLGNESVIRAVERSIGNVGPVRGVRVLDPVMVAKGGASLLDDNAVSALWSLFGDVHVITPNIPELATLMGVRIVDETTAVKAGKELSEATGTAVVVKGGHLEGEDVVDWVFDGKEQHRFASPRIDTRHSHGTGCTLSSAIAFYLGTGLDLNEAVSKARDFVRAALLAAPGFGSGHGPMGHQAVH